MIDLHCHILPGVDDGASSLEESLTMARLLLADGITHVVATPHFTPGMRVTRPTVLREVANLVRELGRAGIPLIVLPGSEVQVASATEYRKQLEAREFCHLGDGAAYTLVEFPWIESRFPREAASLMRWIIDLGLVPIVAHPERQDWSSAPGRIEELVEAGAWLQLTVDSLLGENGPEALARAENFLGRHEHVILATDSHDRDRCSGIAPGLAIVGKTFGAARAADLVARAERVKAALTADRRSGIP